LVAYVTAMINHVFIYFSEGSNNHMIFHLDTCIFQICYLRLRLHTSLCSSSAVVINSKLSYFPVDCFGVLFCSTYWHSSTRFHLLVALPRCFCNLWSFSGSAVLESRWTSTILRCGDLEQFQPLTKTKNGYAIIETNASGKYRDSLFVVKKNVYIFPYFSSYFFSCDVSDTLIQSNFASWTLAISARAVELYFSATILPLLKNKIFLHNLVWFCYSHGGTI